MALIPSVKQSQVQAGVSKCRAQAVKVHVSEAISENDILCVIGVSNGFMSVAKADANVITHCRGPFYVADYAAPLGAYTPVAIPWRLITGIATNAANVGDAVWLSAATAGAYTLGTVPAAVAKGAAFSLAVKVGRVVVSNILSGAILLEPGIATGAPLVGRVTLGGTSTTVTGFTAELDNAPCVVTPTGATADHATQITATIASGTLTLTHDTATDICTYMIQA
jgi:hypothetical protein